MCRPEQRRGEANCRGLQGPAAPRYLSKSHKGLNIIFQLPRLRQGPLNNHLLVLRGVDGTGGIYLPDDFANDLEKRGRERGLGKPSGKSEKNKAPAVTSGGEAMASCLSSIRGQEEAFLCGPLWGMSGELEFGEYCGQVSSTVGLAMSCATSASHSASQNRSLC